MNFFLIVFEAMALSFALSMDAFAASFAYGSNNIKIPMASVQTINVICSAMLGVSLLAGTYLRQFIPARLTAGLCFCILFLLGLVKLLDSVTKSIIRKHNSVSRQIHFSMFNFRFVLSLYADPEAADRDHSKTISPAESASLAVALSLDGIAVGFGAALGNVNILAAVLCSLLTNALAVILGAYAGNKAVQKLPFDFSWISGAILILMAFAKL